MSLLLDALKKAANDKEKSSRGELPEKQITKPKVVSVGGPSTVNEPPSLQNDDIPPAVKTDTAGSQEDKQPISMQLLAARLSNKETGHKKTGPKRTGDPEPLTLDIDHDANEELSLADDDIACESESKLTVETDKAGDYDTEHEITEHEVAEHYDVSLDVVRVETKIAADDKRSNHVSEERSAVSKLTVSDDALSLLINKTNREEKRRRIVVTGSVLLISLLILLSGGLYYYTDMQEEIAAMERRHKIAMQQMRAKTNNEKTPEKTAIIRNLVSDTKLEEKVQYAKEQVAKTKKSVSTPQQSSREVSDQIRPATIGTAGGAAGGTVSNNQKKQTSSGDLTIRKTKKSDPVGENLDAAWSAYDSGNYGDAKQLYRNVLKIEGGNRDAQLGLGAIAVIEEDSMRARRIYSALLQQDPRDPIATAALAGLNSNKDSLVSDNSYLLSMLEKNPDAPHLNFSVGNNYAQQKKWTSAQQYYFKAWQQDSNNADYLFNLAVSMDQLGKSQQAISFYRDSLVKGSNKQVSFSVAAVQKRIDELSGL